MDSTAQDTSRVVLERHGHVLVMRLDRPRRRNAVDYAMLLALAEAYELLGTDDDLRVGVLCATGDHFSAGFDLAEMAPLIQERGPQIVAGESRFDPLGLWKPPVPKPVVMAVSGISFTLSIELALASDIVVANDDVRFGQLEVARGLLPFQGGSIRAPVQLGWGNAMRFLLTAEEFGAAEALRIGLVQEVVSGGAHVERAVEIAERIGRQAPLAVQATLASARAAIAAARDAGTAQMAASLQPLWTSEDAAEGLRSFVERRTADFIGR
jgi:enoyl-CoA hydratase/carnithine racemase